MFFIGAGLTALNLVLLFFFDETEMLSKETKEHLANGYTVKLNNKTTMINANGVVGDSNYIQNKSTFMFKENDEE